MASSRFRRYAMRLTGFLLVIFMIQIFLLLAFVSVDPTRLQKPGTERSVIAPSSPSPALLTIFSILRDFEPGHVSDHVEWLEVLHTHNAIGSWLRLPGVEVILFGVNDSCQLVAELTKKSERKPLCLPIPCVNDKFKTPQYDCLFDKAANLATTEFLMYSNSDIVFFDDLLEALRLTAARFQDFLVVGQRRDLLFPQKIDFLDQQWASRMRTLALDYGEDHGSSGLDYFLYRRQFARSLPPFLVGRIRWDNWLLAQYIGSKKAMAIDGSKMILAVHLNHMKIGDSHIRDGTEYNQQLTKDEVVDPKKIGNIENCDYQLLAKAGNPLRRGSCPECQLIRVNQSLEAMLYKQQTNKTIIIATVDAGYLDFALNWACSLQRLGLDNYLFHATDEKIFLELQGRDLPVVMYVSKLSQDYSEIHGDEVVYGSVSYQSIMNTRTEFITKTLQKGYNVLLSDVDIIFLRNPFPLLDPSVDIQGGAHKDTKITGGFIFTRATANSFKLWSKVLAQHRQLFEKIQTLRTFDIHTNTEQELLNSALLSSLPEQISWKRIPSNVVADGKRFFIDKDTQKSGEWPAVLHNNYIIGAENKRQRFHNISLWLLDDTLQCTGLKMTPHPSPGSQKPMVFVKILTFNRPKSLTRLLTSLEKAVVPASEIIQLDIFVDYPDEEDSHDSATLTNRNLCITMAKAFKWKHGPKNLIIRTKHFGLGGQWLNAWFPASATEVAFILEDDTVVSPHVFVWLKEALAQYFHNPLQFDPQLCGFGLQYQHMIAGKYPQKPEELLRPDTRLFKYQLMSTWGPVMFGSHWASFLTWQANRVADPAFLPLFSNLVTNKWFLERGGGRSVWSAWFIRYCAEQGLYMLYTNFENHEALVVNHRDSGINYKESKGPNSPTVTSLEGKMDFPPLDAIPTYDFHFNEINDSPLVLQGRGVYSDIFNIQTV